MEHRVKEVFITVPLSGASPAQSQTQQIMQELEGRSPNRAPYAG